MKNAFLSAADRSIFGLAFLAIFIIPSNGYSQTSTNIKGEIVNVNHHLRVAFVDIGQKYLDVGDVLEVQTAHNAVVYMQVLEASGVISKIGFGPVIERNFKIKPSDFEEIKIGNIAGKIELHDPYTQSTRKESRQAQSVSRIDAQEAVTGGGPEESTGASREISLQLEESIKEIEQSKYGDRIDEKEYHGVVKEEQGCRADMIRCIEKNERLENKISVLRKKLEYIHELINKNAQN